MEDRARTDIVPDRLDDLVLARIAAARRPPPLAAIVKATRPFAPTTHDDTRWSAAVAEAHVRLTDAGRLDGESAAVGGAAAAAARLGLGGARSWKQLAGKLVPALALGIPATDARALARLKDRDAWVAAILGRALGLWTDGPSPSLGAACDALVWRTLALPGRPGRTPAALRAHFLGLALGVVAGGGTAPPYERRAAQLAAREVGAPRADLTALREALVRRWLTDQPWPPSRSPAPGAPTAIAPPTSVASADEFAAAVRAAAERATDGVFGPRKVFISRVWRDPAFQGVSLAEFKRRLLQAHRAGAVTLARADLVAVMDPELVRESETEHLESRYHFIERGGTP